LNLDKTKKSKTGSISSEQKNAGNHPKTQEQNIETTQKYSRGNKQPDDEHGNVKL